MFKLVMGCIVEDDKVNGEIIEEKVLSEFEEEV